MALMHNQVIRVRGTINDGQKPSPTALAGLYRVVLNDARQKIAVLVQIDQQLNTPSRGGRHPALQTKNKRKKPKARLCGQLIWVDHQTLEGLDKQGLVDRVEIERESVYFQASHALLSPDEPSGSEETSDTAAAKNDWDGKARQDNDWKRRVRVMDMFLDQQKLHGSILTHRNLARLVDETVCEKKVSRTQVYQLWSLLCKLGFDPLSLMKRYDRCGAPGVRRYCVAGVQAKAGRKDRNQRKSAEAGLHIESQQPGMTADWAQRILWADSQIASPKPRMNQRHADILRKAFVTAYQQDGAKLKPVLAPQGEYPNLAQTRRVLQYIDQLQALRESTTGAHFDRSHRGIRSRSWQGVAGPGHTWAIDSTVGDMYLRSSLCRAWILGRPIVYIIVDVWSTAITGFYVCLEGPSWETAKLAIFNAVAPADLVGSLWGYDPWTTLSPAPTLPFMLLCDRGEILSQAAAQTFFKLDINPEYTEPYRPNLKGIVEVLHRIAKDAAYQRFIPGAIDMRRKEFDLRKYRPEHCVFTLREFVQYLHLVFARYNLTADRRKRVDAPMAAAGVQPTPAGLWRFGHEEGVGFQQYKPLDDLISELLPRAEATVINGGLSVDSALYDTNISQTSTFSARALNFGRWKLPVHFYPGCMAKVWTPATEGKGLLELQLSDLSDTSEISFLERRDALEYHSLDQPKRDHEALTVQVQADAAIKALVATASAATAAESSKVPGSKPSISEVREMEVAARRPNDPQANAPIVDTTASAEESPEVSSAYRERMRSQVLQPKLPGEGQ